TDDEPKSRESTRQLVNPVVTPDDRDDEEPTEAPEAEDAEAEAPELETFRSQYHDLLTGNDEGNESLEAENPFDAIEVDAPEADEDGDEDGTGDADETTGAFDLPSFDSVDDAPSLDSDDFREVLRDRVDGADEQDTTAQPPKPAAETVRSDVAPSADDRIRNARSSGDDARLAEVIAEILAGRDRSDDESAISEDRALELRRELAELYYYDLEDTEAARPHLEALRDRDPDGHGAEPTVLRALESIYERDGNTDGRIAILETQLDRADTDEGAATYRMLLAQLYWEQKHDRDRAEALLETTLEADPDHEGAHRLLAEICTDEGDWQRAAEHLSAALEVAGDGLDALELKRELADLHLDHLDEPAAAADHFAEVLEDAPGDSRALEGHKQAQRQLDDWSGYLDSLRHELGVQLGQPASVAFEEVDHDRLDEGGRMAASQIVAEAADIARQQLQDPQRAWTWYGEAFAIWNQNLEALEQRMALDRSLDKREALADDLERYADGLLDPTARFQALWEAARLYEDLGDEERSGDVLARAIDAGSEADPPPDDLEA
ncbi:MAG: tetratricopeptide repeat protein, partial [Bradymonadaceae bacterium]